MPNFCHGEGHRKKGSRGSSEGPDSQCKDKAARAREHLLKKKGDVKKSKN